MRSRTTGRLVVALAIAGGASAAAPVSAAAAASAAVPPAPRIEVVFVLDTTGSMSALIEGAKLKIWSIANQMVASRPRPHLRIGLLGYRDRGDQYVTRFSDLSEDIDAVYAELSSFRADGGGDGPESVNQALAEAVSRPSWSPGHDVLKVIFLVGDAPPHMDYADDVKYPLSCRKAAARDIVVNTVQCGADGETRHVWQEVARLTEGDYLAIGPTGDMRATTTPMDAELAELNRALGHTIVAYGSTAAREEAKARQARSEAAPAPAAAARLAYKSAASSADRAAGMPMGVAGGVVGGVVGGGDLVDDEASGRARLDTLAKDELPAEMRGLSAEQQRSYLAKKRAEREALSARIAELVKKRQEYLRAEQERAAVGHRDAFDEKVAETIRAQAARRGLR